MPPASRELQLGRFWYALGAVLLISVAVVSLMPVQGDLAVNDKIGHLLTYLLLSGWFAMISASRRVLCLSVLALVGYGILIEFLQSLTGYRFAELGDVIANSIGAALGALLYWSSLNRRLRRLETLLVGRLAG